MKIGPGGGADPAAARIKTVHDMGPLRGPAAYGAAGHPGISHVFNAIWKELELHDG